MLGSISSTPVGSEFPVVQRFQAFIDFWEDILTSIANHTISFSLMSLLHQNEDQKFNDIHRLYDKYNPREQKQKLSMSGVFVALKEFSEVESRFQRLSSFQKVFMFDSKYLDKNLKQLNELVTEIESKRGREEFTLTHLFGYNWEQFDPIEESLKTLYRSRESTIKIRFWNDIVNTRQAKWSMKALKDMNTFDISVWLRENYRTVFVFKEK